MIYLYISYPRLKGNLESIENKFSLSFYFSSYLLYTTNIQRITQVYKIIYFIFRWLIFIFNHAKTHTFHNTISPPNHARTEHGYIAKWDDGYNGANTLLRYR